MANVTPFKCRGNTIGIVSQRLSSGGEIESLVTDISDPLVRDTALAAVQQLAPSKKSKIESVMLFGKDLPEHKSATLTTEIRTSLRKWLKKPSESTDCEEFTGVIREIDLDLQRFSLRRLVGSEIQEVRCIYADEFAVEAKKNVDKSVVVAGSVQHDSTGRARLLHITAIRSATAQKPLELF